MHSFVFKSQISNLSTPKNQTKEMGLLGLDLSSSSSCKVSPLLFPTSTTNPLPHFNLRFPGKSLFFFIFFPFPEFKSFPQEKKKMNWVYLHFCGYFCFRLVHGTGFRDKGRTRIAKSRIVWCSANVGEVRFKYFEFSDMGKILFFERKQKLGYLSFFSFLIYFFDDNECRRSLMLL